MSDITLEEQQQHVRRTLASLRAEGQDVYRLKIETVLRADELGLSLREIAYELEVSAQTVSNMLKRAKQQ